MSAALAVDITSPEKRQLAAYRKFHAACIEASRRMCIPEGASVEEQARLLQTYYVACISAQLQLEYAIAQSQSQA